MSRPRWWRLAGALQRALSFAVLLGGVWLLALAVLGYLRIDEVVPLPELYGVPIPTWLVLGGVVVGIVLAFLARLVNGAGASRRARAAGRSLRAGIEEVAEELVLAPVERELDVRARLCAAVETASGARRPSQRRG